MQLTSSFIALLDEFRFVFTAPSFDLFVAILTGWTLSQRHRFVTELIFASGNVRNGHWSRFHKFFSHGAWDLDRLSAVLARLVVRVLCPGAWLLWAVDDTLCRKRGLTLFGVGMHYDPLISSKSKALTSWGHDWVVLCLVIVGPFWAPNAVFALPIAMRLYRNRQGVTKGKKGKTKAQKGKTKTTTGKAKDKTDHPDHRTRPELAVELLGLVATWFPDHQHMVVADNAYGGNSVLSHLPADNVHLISGVCSTAARYTEAPPKQPGTRGAPRKKGDRLPSMAEWADDPDQPWTEMTFDQFGLHTTLAVKTQTALDYKAGGSRPLTIVLTRDLVGGRPDRMFFCTHLDWSAAGILSAFACRWAIECTFWRCKQDLGLEDPANRLPKAVKRTAPVGMMLYTLIVVWFHQVGHASVRFPDRPWYTHKREPSFMDMLTTLRRVSYEEKLHTLLPVWGALKIWLSQLIELLSRAG